MYVCMVCVYMCDYVWWICVSVCMYVLCVEDSSSVRACGLAFISNLHPQNIEKERTNQWNGRSQHLNTTFVICVFVCLIFLILLLSCLFRFQQLHVDTQSFSFALIFSSISLAFSLRLVFLCIR